MRFQKNYTLVYHQSLVCIIKNLALTVQIFTTVMILTGCVFCKSSLEIQFLNNKPMKFFYTFLYLTLVTSCGKLTHGK